MDTTKISKNTLPIKSTETPVLDKNLPILKKLNPHQRSIITKTNGGAVDGINARLITIEINIISGNKLFMVGLPDNAIKESQHRIESVIKHIGCTMPRKRVIVNLAPADIRKEGAAYDLPIALAILHCSNQFEFKELDKYIIMGELALDGMLRPIKGVLPIAIEARRKGLKGFILPKENAKEASIINNIDIIGISHIREAIGFLTNKVQIEPLKSETRKKFFENYQNHGVDFSDVQGQSLVKRALEVGAAGSHNLIMIGPPGSGKTMLAKRVITILPPFTLSESLETTKIYSVTGKLNELESLISERPFRSPHHTISDAALVGGGSIPQPGELSLAHNGVLFLDELPEFKRGVLEAMRQPLEERVVSICRSKTTMKFPTNFMLIASMNPCPCGYYNHPKKNCTCAPEVVSKYLNKISGPLMDRIDIQLEVIPISFNEMTKNTKEESSEDIRNRVIKARNIQIERYKEYPDIYSNSMITPMLAKKFCKLNDEANELLKQAMDKLRLSARAYDRILKVGRTIADLDSSEGIGVNHVAEAIGYRRIDREGWWGS